MATLTFEHSSFSGGLVRVEFDVNDANWRVTRVRCINNSPHRATARVLEAGVEVFSAVATANATSTWNVTGIQLGWQPDYWNDLSQQWERAGIDMRNYSLLVTWPAE